MVDFNDALIHKISKGLDNKAGIKKMYTTPIEMLKQYKPFENKEVEHYYRRFNKFYFRTIDKKETISIIVANSLIEPTKKGLKIGDVLNFKAH